MNISIYDKQWDVVPTNGFYGFALAALCFYLVVCGVRYIVAVIDIYSDAPMPWVGFMRRTGWVPDKQKLRKPIVRSAQAIALLAGYLVAGAEFGWITFEELN